MKGQVKDEVKKARSERLLTLNEQDGRRFREEFLGSTVEVLIEDYKHGYWEGLTDNYLRVGLEGLSADRNWQNTLIKARLMVLLDDGVLGIVLQEKQV